jgi:pyruvate/2-oxoglutarate dehydrogenase complex dihydrolipoamide dehydrogenase (E3) component
MKVVVLGGGPAGMAAALQSRTLNADVVLVESKRVGGTSINEGPAPVRTLARAARLMRDVKSWETFGLKGIPPEIDIGLAINNARRVALYAHEKKHLVEHLRSRGIEVFEGTGPAQFRDHHTVSVNDGRSWNGDKIIIAVGGHSRVPQIPGVELAMTYEDIWGLHALPETVAVIGAAATGCQLASILEDFGCKVTLIEFASRIVPQEDEQISLVLENAFRKRGIRIIANALTERLERVSEGIEINYRAKETADNLIADAVFFATGWTGNIESLNLQEAQVNSERGYIPVNSFLQTNVPHIFAVGDVNGQSMLVQSARYEGRIAAENAILNHDRRFTHIIVPSGSFTDPEYASVGLTEAEARSKYDCATSVVDYHDLLRPVIDDHPDGFCKLVVDKKTHSILGAHVVGEYSVEIIQMVAACMAGDMKVDQVAELQLAVPTFTEAVGLAAQKIVRELKLAPLPEMWADPEPS